MNRALDASAVRRTTIGLVVGLLARGMVVAIAAGSGFLLI